MGKQKYIEILYVYVNEDGCLVSVRGTNQRWFNFMTEICVYVCIYHLGVFTTIYDNKAQLNSFYCNVGEKKNNHMI